MTAVQALAVVLIRLWAVGNIISTFFVLFQSLGLVVWGEEMHKGTYGYLQVATFSLLLLFWLLVLGYSRSVAAWALPPVREADHRIRISPEDLISVGTFIVGIFYLTEYVPDLLRSIQPAVMQYIEGAGTWGPSPIRLIEFAVSIIAILFALWLVIRPGHVARLYAWLRSAGAPKEEKAPATRSAE